ncbi:MAG: EMC3/TMCO1 family protein [Candidatus Micrarchaeales archaeon]
MIEIEITIIALVYVIFSISTQRKLINPKRNYEIQDAIKQKSKELSELSRNKASQEQLLAKQREVTALLSESMKSQLKPMFVILPIFFVMYYVLFPAIFPSDSTVTLLSMKFDYKTYFIILAFVFGLALSIIMMARDRIKMKKEASNAPESKL